MNPAVLWTTVFFFLVLFLTIPFVGPIQALPEPQEPFGSTKQEPTAAQDAAKDSELRIVYVAVVDKNRVPITDLKFEDFTIRENGVPQQIVDVTPTSETPLVLGVLVDVSGSASGQSSRHEKLNVLLQFLGSKVGKSEEAYITAFAMKPLRLTGITSNPLDLQAGLREVDTAHPIGSTALYDSVISAASTLPPDLPGRKILIVLSDFEDNSSGHGLDGAIFGVQKSGTAVFALVEINELNLRERRVTRVSKAARQFAEETGGTAYFIRTPKDMGIALEHLQLLLRSSYAVKYHAGAATKKDGSVPLKIEVHRKDATVIATGQRPPALP